MNTEENIQRILEIRGDNVKLKKLEERKRNK